MRKGTALRFNKKEVTLPWFVVGQEEWDLKATIESIQKAAQAQKS